MSRIAESLSRQMIVAAGLVWAMTTLVLLVAGGCSPRPLPEEGSAAAELYSTRCSGECHLLYYPTLMTADMWTTMVGRMDIEMRRRGVPLLEAERDEILAYLRRNAARQ